MDTSLAAHTSGDASGEGPGVVVHPDAAVGTSSKGARWRRMRVWAGAHAVDDFYQGLVPAAIPYFVLARGYSYTQASGLALAATIGSALPQPLLGHLVDRYPLRGIAPMGLVVAGLGAALAGLAQPYWLVCALLLFSGLGVALFHPAAGRGARDDAGDSAEAMSIFAAGGKVGYFLAPVLVTPALVALGLGATVLFLPPAALMAAFLWRHHQRHHTTVRAPRKGRDRWWAFSALAAVEVVRSTMSVGLNTFVVLYWVRSLGAPAALGGLVLAAVLAGAVGGTVVGGRLANRFGMVVVVRAGNLAALPAFVLLRLAPGPATGLAAALVTGFVLSIPFGVLVKLGQDYLPTRPATAAGVTLGLAVSIGGLFTPVLGRVADRSGPGGALTVLCVLPVLAALLSLAMPEPTSPSRDAIA